MQPDLLGAKAVCSGRADLQGLQSPCPLVSSDASFHTARVFSSITRAGAHGLARVSRAPVARPDYSRNRPCPVPALCWCASRSRFFCFGRGEPLSSVGGKDG